MCPTNRIGTVDLFVVSHHGQPVSNADVLVHAIKSRVAIMNNGTRKGGQPDAMRIIHSAPGLEDLWQLHFSLLSGQDYTVPGLFIANADRRAAGRHAHRGDGAAASPATCRASGARAQRTGVLDQGLRADGWIVHRDEPAQPLHQDLQSQTVTDHRRRRMLQGAGGLVAADGAAVPAGVSGTVITTFFQGRGGYHRPAGALHGGSARPEPPAAGGARSASTASWTRWGRWCRAPVSSPARWPSSYVREQGGVPEASVLTTNIRTSAINAALANGMFGHADETDDFEPVTKAHPGCAVVPAALAMAEREGRSGIGAAQGRHAWLRSLLPLSHGARTGPRARHAPQRGGHERHVRRRRRRGLAGSPR